MSYHKKLKHFLHKSIYGRRSQGIIKRLKDKMPVTTRSQAKAYKNYMDNEPKTETNNLTDYKHPVAQEANKKDNVKLYSFYVPLSEKQHEFNRIIKGKLNELEYIHNRTERAVFITGIMMRILNDFENICRRNPTSYKRFAFCIYNKAYNMEYETDDYAEVHEVYVNALIKTLHDVRTLLLGLFKEFDFKPVYSNPDNHLDTGVIVY